MQKIIYQAALDILFSEVDKNIEDYLKTLKWVSKPVTSLTELQKKLWISWEPWTFSATYATICRNTLYAYVWEYMNKNNLWNLTTDKFTPEALWWIDCDVLYRTKLRAYYDAWEVIIKREHMNYQQYARKDLMSNLKWKYRRFLMKLIIYLWQLRVLSWKFYENTVNPSN